MQKDDAIAKITKAEYIPKSVRSNFQLGASDRAKMSNEYNALVSASDTLKKEYERQQKLKIIETARLERELLNQDHQAILIDGMVKIT
jgi:hypothetical protein